MTKSAYLAVINPAAGHGRCGKLVGRALDRLRAAGVELEAVETRYAGHATEIAREAYREGYRRFLAVGGDGTSFEIVNGLFPEASEGEKPALGFLPLGTGNSFLRDFSGQGLDHAFEAITAGRLRPCDVLRMKHKQGVVHYINLLSVGFVADVAVVANRRFKRMGQLGYWLGIIVCLARLNRRAFPLSLGPDREIDRRRCLLLTFNNSKFTGGKMMLAPNADISDGLIEYVRWGPIGRLGLLSNLPGLYDGSHINQPLASRAATSQINFYLNEPIDVMVDGEVLTIHCEQLDVLPSALNVIA
ncbi:MAG TPA: diacylglycerol kinase family protein [Blastocatellia bacterium]|nr:diacylglycerol kinase family protein [Blastocatellia bacterium]